MSFWLMDDGTFSRFCCGELKLIRGADEVSLYLLTRFLWFWRIIEGQGAAAANDTAAFHVTCSSPPILSSVFPFVSSVKLSSSGSPPPSRFLCLSLPRSHFSCPSCYSWYFCFRDYVPIGAARKAPQGFIL